MSDPSVTDSVAEAVKHAGSGGTGALLVAGLWRLIAGKNAADIKSDLDGLRTHLDARLNAQDSELKAIGAALEDRRRHHELLAQHVETLDAEVKSVRKRLHDLVSSVTAALGDLRELRVCVGLRGIGSHPVVPPASSDSGLSEP